MKAKLAFLIIFITSSMECVNSQSYDYYKSKTSFNIAVQQLSFVNSKYSSNIQSKVISGGVGFTIGLASTAKLFNWSLDYSYTPFAIDGSDEIPVHNGLHLYADLNMLKRYKYIRPYVGIGYMASFLSVNNDKGNQGVSINGLRYRIGTNVYLSEWFHLFVNYSQNIPTGLTNLSTKITFKYNIHNMNMIQFGIALHPYITKN